MVSTRRKRSADNGGTDTNTTKELDVIEDGHDIDRLSGVISDNKRKYEELRDQRIKENKERMQNLGILELSLSLNSKLVSPKKPTRTVKKPPNPLPLSDTSPRRSSRLKTRTPVNYTEIGTEKKRGASKDLKIRIREGLKPEIYTEEHEKLLGDSKTGWVLYVDGYGKNGKRIYDPEIGETCHQCRQKTLGRHTHCSQCELVQGQFCGDCLYMRYGENVIEANKNPNWICPACRGICNCSICRKERGWAPTGAIYRKVAKLGFKSVAHYLIQTRRKQIHPEDSGIASLGSEGKEEAHAERGSQLATHISADEHQDTSSDMQSDDHETDVEEED